MLESRRNFILLIVVSVFCCALSRPAESYQSRRPSSLDQKEMTHYARGPRSQIASIIFSGLGGAILGLSTLSFYGRPQDKMINIAIGAALGVVVGTVIVTYQTATQPYNLYPEDFSRRGGYYEFDFNKRKVIDSTLFDASVPLLNVKWYF